MEISQKPLAEKEVKKRVHENIEWKAYEEIQITVSTLIEHQDEY